MTKYIRACLVLIASCLLPSVAVAQPNYNQVTFPDQFVLSDPGTCAAGQTIYNLTSGLSKRCGTNNNWIVGAAGSSVWGGITGTLSSQTDLQSALNAKAGVGASTTVDGQNCTLGSSCTTTFAGQGDAPASVHVLGTNSGKTPVAATAADLSALDYGTGGGIAQAQTVTLTQPVASLTPGLWVCWTPIAANTGAAPTLAVSGLAAKPITKLGTGALIANDLTTTAIACARYDGTEFQLFDPQTSAGGGLATVGVNGSTQTFQPRVNLIPGANVTISGANNGGTSSTDITISASGGGGGSATPPYTTTVSNVATATILQSTHLQGTNPVVFLFDSSASSYSATAATNATPIVVTVASTTGLSVGSVVGISGVLGNTAANGIWTLSAVTGTTMTLTGSAGNGAYTSGGTIAVAAQSNAATAYRDGAGDVLLNFAPNFTGTIQISNGGGSGVTGCGTPDTNLTCSVSGNTLTLTWLSTLAFSRLASISTNQVLGNVSGITGSVSGLTQTQLTALINACTGTVAGAVPTGGGGTAKFLREDCTWVVPTGGGGSVFTGSTASTSAFSATPTFSLADVSVKSPVRFEPAALTAAVTAVTFTNKSAGAKFSIVWLEDATGGRAVTYGASAQNTCTIDSGMAANATVTQFFEVAADGTTVNGTGCVSNSLDIVRQTEKAAPGTPAASTGVCWFDSTNHIFSCEENSSATVFNLVVPLTCTNQVFTGLSAAGVFTCAAPFTLTTTGSSGPATFSSGTLNIPQYSGGSGCAPGGSSTNLLTDNGAGLCNSNSNAQLSSGGILTKYDGITTVGLGVPVVAWKSNVTNQSTSQTTVTLATAPGAGDYEIHYYANLNTACTTGQNWVVFSFSFVDASGTTRTLTTGQFNLESSQTTGSFLSGLIPLHVGSGNVTYSSTVTGTCATGTSSYDINLWMARAN